MFSLDAFSGPRAGPLPMRAKGPLPVPVPNPTPHLPTHAQTPQPGNRTTSTKSPGAPAGGCAGSGPRARTAAGAEPGTGGGCTRHAPFSPLESRGTQPSALNLVATSQPNMRGTDWTDMARPPGGEGRVRSDSQQVGPDPSDTLTDAQRAGHAADSPGTCRCLRLHLGSWQSSTLP